MNKKILCCLIALYPFVPVQGVNTKAVNYYGEIASGEIFRGQVIAREQLAGYVKSIDVLPQEIKKKKGSLMIDQNLMQMHFKDEMGEEQKETLQNFVSFFEEANPEEKMGLYLLVKKIIDNLS